MYIHLLLCIERNCLKFPKVSFTYKCIDCKHLYSSRIHIPLYKDIYNLCIYSSRIHIALMAE